MRTNKKKGTKKRQGRGGQNKQKLKVQHSGVNHRTKITDDETDVRLHFRKQDYIVGAGPLFVKNFTPNAAYDVDPALGSTETYGFDEYAALYSYYRVIGYSYIIQVVTTERTNNAVTVYILNTNVQPTGSRFDLYSTNPYCQTKLLTPVQSAGHITFRGRHPVSQIVGTMAPETEDNYRALTTAVPADLVWLTLAAESVSGGDVAFQYLIDIYMDIRFYGREYDLTLAAFAARANAKLAARAEFELKKKLRLSTTLAVKN